MTPAVDNSRSRRVRSFVRRAGRVTTGQRRALDTLWPRWGLAAGEGTLDFARVFGRQGQVVLEIGFGDGDALVEMARHRPDQDFIGIDVHAPGIGRCLMSIAAAGIDNVRLAEADAVEFLRLRVPAGSLARVNLFFPDPWPKKRHHKRRILQPAFVALLHSRLSVGGLLHVATDWAPYAEHIRGLMAGASGFVGEPCPGDRPATKFERRGRRLGHGIADLCWRRR